MQYGEVKWGLLEKAHECVRSVVSVGDVVVDATIGNGHDTLFLAECVGDSGKVIGFDVQQAALDSTRARLLDAGVSSQCFELCLASHARMREFVDAEVSAVMFNLGYFPGADKEVITKTESTLAALDQAMELLGARGVLSVMCYPGHAGGDTEARAVGQWMDEFLQKNLKNGAFVTCWRREKSQEKTPFLFVVRAPSL